MTKKSVVGVSEGEIIVINEIYRTGHTCRVR